MIDAYRIGIRLNLNTSNVASGLRDLQRRFQQLHETAQKTGNQFERGSAALRSLSSEAGKAGRAVREVGQGVALVRENAAGAARGVRAVARDMDSVARATSAVSNRFSRLAGNIERVGDESKASARGVRSMSQAMDGLTASTERARTVTRNLAAVASSMARAGAAEYREKERSAVRSARERESAAARTARAEAAAARQTAREWSEAYSRMLRDAGHTHSGIRQLAGGSIGTPLTLYGMGAAAGGSIQDVARMEAERYRAQKGGVRDMAYAAANQQAADQLREGRPEVSRVTGLQTVNEATHLLGPNLGRNLAGYISDTVAVLEHQAGRRFTQHERNQVVSNLTAVLEQVGVARNGAVVDRDRLERHLNGIVRYSQVVEDPNLTKARDMARHGGAAIPAMTPETLWSNASAVVPTTGGRGAGTFFESPVGTAYRPRLTQAQAELYVGSGAIRLQDLEPDGGMFRLKEGATYQPLTVRYTDSDGQERTHTVASPVSDPSRYSTAMLQNTARRFNISEEEAAARWTRETQRKGQVIANNNLAQGFRVQEDLEARRASGYSVTQEAADLRRNSTVLAISAFQAALSDLSLAVGEALKPVFIDALRALTSVMRQVAEFAEKNPDLLRQVAGDLLALFVAGGAIPLMIAGVGALSGALALFAAGSLAMTVLEALTGERGLDALAAGIQAVGTAFSLVPMWLIEASMAALAAMRVGGPVAAAAAFTGVAGMRAGQQIGRQLGDTPTITAEEGLRRFNADMAAQREAEQRRSGGLIQRARDRNGPSAVPLGTSDTSSSDRTVAPFAVPPPPERVINLTVQNNIDGQRVGEVVLNDVGRRMEQAPRGYPGFDPRMSPQMPGVTVPP